MTTPIRIGISRKKKEEKPYVWLLLEKEGKEEAYVTCRIAAVPISVASLSRFIDDLLVVVK